ncbi:sensor histidine kinase [Streptomyces sp. NPDC091377]|uniref:sensor histidine kinase n=1 Tax=Streptomyces sp. NPDC091377 TaxID=3365995 RepID=UPI0037F50FC6
MIRRGGGDGDGGGDGRVRGGRRGRDGGGDGDGGADARVRGGRRVRGDRGDRGDRRGRLTVGARLALSNSTALTVGGLALLALNWHSVRDLLDANRSLLAVSPTLPAESPSAPPATDPAPSPSHPLTEPWPTVPGALFEEFRDTVMRELLARSVLLIVVVAALSLLAGWWIARRSLIRVTQVAEAARHIGDTNLHDRLALTGPHDEVRELGDTFDAMLERLERSFAAQRDFIALASHELRTPLTLTRTALEIPLAQRRVPDDLAPALRRALASVDRSERLIASLLALARGESGLAHARGTEAARTGGGDLADHVRTALADVREEAEELKVTLHTDLGPAPTAGDATLLEQLALNFVVNAVRHNHPGGTVHITTGAAAGRCWIEVRNTGPTVAAPDIPALLEPFHRGTHPHRAGSGLGLTVARTVTDTHRGDLTVHPNPTGGGLTVRAELPAHRT